ncbi:hypothetical protein GRI62_00215 [Erythrobacter arachoides]|uniref:EF-hand domain-containing protein n=1 Tax=Aurantiacibacter arachoides TaxID=1850444 RepID=A0A844ZWB7_9SPHN|nr:hypothetical protein [Aurantiacibacter arachoides]MXO92028.1 hypothetical protein [Aurantiacibacter arachoides]GGD60325.1 hypothetical protein GCM10011411_20620 [Aurantiacibacter arachoides]
MTRTITFAIAAASLAIGGAAVAQDRPARADRTADVTRAAAETRATATFARMDANSDGVLNAADREARARTMFAAQDANGDGLLSFEEMQAHRTQMRSERGENGQRMMRRGHRGMAGMGMRGTRSADAELTAAQFTAAALARFDAADADDNGTVTAAERRSQWQERRQDRAENRRGQRPAQ